MKKIIIFVMVIAFGMTLSGCSYQKEGVSGTINNNSGSTNDNGQTVIVDSFEKEGLLISGDVAVNVENTGSTNPIIERNQATYGFLNNMIKLQTKNVLQNWSYKYDASIGLTENIYLKSLSGERTYVTIIKTPNQTSNKCSLYKDNNASIQGTYVETNKEYNGINIKTVLSQLSFTFDGKTNKDWYGVGCFTLGNYDYEIHVTTSNKENLVSILSSVVIAK